MDKEKILKRLNELKCKVHDVEPNAKITVEGIQYENCCEDFRKKVLKILRQEAISHIKGVNEKFLSSHC